MNKHEKSVVIPTVIGGAVEFYEVYTNLYWYPLLTTAFYTFTSHFLEFFTLGIMLITQKAGMAGITKIFKIL